MERRPKLPKGVDPVRERLLADGGRDVNNLWAEVAQAAPDDPFAVLDDPGTVARAGMYTAPGSKQKELLREQRTTRGQSQGEETVTDTQGARSAGDSATDQYYEWWSNLSPGMREAVRNAQDRDELEQLKADALANRVESYDDLVTGDEDNESLVDWNEWQ